MWAWHAWPSHRTLAQCECRVEGRGGCLAMDRLSGAAAGVEPVPKLWGTGGQTGREPLVWTDHVSQMELQPCDHFPLLDRTKRFQARHAGSSTALKVNSRGSASSCKLCDLGQMSSPPPATCFILTAC